MEKITTLLNISVPLSECELWTSDAERQSALAERVKDKPLEQQLRCRLDRIRWKIERYEKYGISDRDRAHVRSLTLTREVLTAHLELELDQDQDQEEGVIRD